MNIQTYRRIRDEAENTIPQWKDGYVFRGYLETFPPKYGGTQIVEIDDDDYNTGRLHAPTNVIQIS